MKFKFILIIIHFDLRNYPNDTWVHLVTSTKAHEIYRPSNKRYSPFKLHSRTTICLDYLRTDLHPYYLTCNLTTLCFSCHNIENPIKNPRRRFYKRCTRRKPFVDEVLVNFSP